DFVVTKTGQFLAHRVSLSAGPEEIPAGPRRRMPHGINYIHGTSHYNSGILVFTDFPDALSHFTDRRFRREVYRFVHAERREVLGRPPPRRKMRDVLRRTREGLRRSPGAVEETRSRRRTHCPDVKQY